MGWLLSAGSTKASEKAALTVGATTAGSGWSVTRTPGAFHSHARIWQAVLNGLTAADMDADAEPNNEEHDDEN
jgi:hypothetical protein